MTSKYFLPPLAVMVTAIFFSCSKPSDSTSTTSLPGTTSIPSSGIIFAGDIFIYVMNVDGTNPRKLSLSKENYSEDYPSSSPDGKKIVFRRHSKGIVMQDNSGEKIILNDSNSPMFPTWSYNSKIYYTRWNGLVTNSKEYIYAINADGTGDIQVSPVFSDVASPLDYYPSVSPDNSTLIFSTNRPANGGTILKEVLSTSSTSYLTYSGNVLGESLISPAEQPTWSPSGGKIAFSAYPGYPDFSRKEQIYVMNPDGSGKVVLTNETGARCTFPSWSPDGTKIVFQKSYPGFSNCFEIWIMNSDGSNPKALTNRLMTGYEQHPCFIGKPR